MKLLKILNEEGQKESDWVKRRVRKNYHENNDIIEKRVEKVVKRQIRFYFEKHNSKKASFIKKGN